MTRLAGRFRAIAMLTIAVPALAVAVAALTGGSSALGATTPGAIAPSYLFSIPSASGSLTGRNGHHLTLRLTGTRDYLTRFTDRSLRPAFVVADADFARRFKPDFAGSRPDAVLTYTPAGDGIPVSIVLRIGQPRWNAPHHTWTFPATRIRTPTDNLPGAAIHINPPMIPNPHTFTHATLLIDDSANCDQGVFQPYEDCQDSDLAFVDLTGADLTGVNFTDANLTYGNLTGVNLTGVDFTGAQLTGAQLTGTDLTGSDLAGEELSDQDFIGSDLSDVDFTGADLTGSILPGVNLAGADLASANLTDVDLTGADLTDADLTGADVNGADFRGARFCGAILPGGSIGGDC